MTDLSPQGESAVRLALEVGELRRRLARVEALCDARDRRADEWDALCPDVPLARIVRVDDLRAALADTTETPKDEEAADE